MAMDDTRQNPNNKLTLTRPSPELGRLRIVELIITKSICAINPTALPPDPRMMKITASAWDDVLSPIPTDQLENAYRLAMRTRDGRSVSFPINAPEIYNAWVGSSKSDQAGPALAWSLVVAAMRVVRAPQQPKFDDPLINALVKRFGWFWMTHNEKQEDVRFAFIEAYKQLQSSPNPESDGLRKELPAFDQAALPNPEVEKQIADAAGAMSFGSRKENILEGVAKMREALGKPLPPREIILKGPACGNCSHVALRATRPFSYFCTHETVKTEDSAVKFVGHDGTTAPDWCPLKKAS